MGETGGEMGHPTPSGGEGGMARGGTVPQCGIHCDQPAPEVGEPDAVLQRARDRGAVDQGGKNTTTCICRGPQIIRKHDQTIAATLLSEETQTLTWSMTFGTWRNHGAKWQRSDSNLWQ